MINPCTDQLYWTIINIINNNSDEETKKRRLMKILSPKKAEIICNHVKTLVKELVKSNKEFMYLDREQQEEYRSVCEYIVLTSGAELYYQYLASENPINIKIPLSFNSYKNFYQYLPSADTFENNIIEEITNEW